MLNEILMDNPEVNKLKIIIADFKKYDKERKEYYANVLVELGQLKSYVEELEESEDIKIAKLRRKIKAQKAAIKSLTCCNNLLKSKLEKCETELKKISLMK